MALRDEILELLTKELEGYRVDVHSITDDIWEILQENLGPAQEHFMNTIEMLRVEKRQVENRLEAALNELSRVQQ